MSGLGGRGPRAFTLVELLVTVAVVGVLAVLATYGVRKYALHSKTTEARNQLGRMAQDAAAAYEVEKGPVVDGGAPASVLTQGATTNNVRRLCKTGTNPVPDWAAGSDPISGAKYQSTTAEWNFDAVVNAGFACLKYSMDEPQYYRYQYVRSGNGKDPGNTFTGKAFGDLNGDGVYSTFSLTGAINSAYAINVAPNLIEVQPEE